MKVTIRGAVEAEAQQLSEIALAAKKYWDYPEAYFRLWRDALKITPEFIANNDVWAAVHRGKILGFAAISIDKSVAELEHMWVLPKYTGKGIGKQLMNTVIEYCGDAGIRTLRIESDPNARGFYEKMGARLTGFVEAKPRPRKLPVLELEF